MKKPTPLKLAIVQSGRPQKDIAAELGLQEATLSRYVHGLFVPIDRRSAIAAAVECTPAELWPDEQAAA